ncbi:uncharacterized protein LOC129744963 [Uranotaenia lowii]|uniref:uncharacterized protein LOC129744963 n=1 Tax=Uranotaenia lowii TaxID=190385 RepID=UPI002478DF29|nr:uncharacterized protein LOC129744963 [Uranotaenia lowii]
MMAGHLFVVQIPTARYEKVLRQKIQDKLAKSSSTKFEDEKEGPQLVGSAEDEQKQPLLATSGDPQSFLTPQPRKHQLKEPAKDDQLRRSLLDLTEQNQEPEPKQKQPPDQVTSSETGRDADGEDGSNNAQTIPFIDCTEGTPKTPVAAPAQGDEKDGKANLAVPFDRASALRKSWEGFKDILGSARKEKEKDPRDVEAEKFNLDAESSLEDVMKEIIREKKIQTASWTESNKGRGYQIVFSLESGRKVDDVIYLLSTWGIGERFGSTLAITPCTLFTEQLGEEEDSSESNAGGKDGAWNTFLSSVRARLNVAQIVEEVKHDASITFDFVSMLCVASILAAFGLIEDSTLFLIASMLISPLMGPIIAGIFGTVIKERSLQLMGLKNEMIGISLTTSVGFIFGLIVCSLDERYGVGEGITNEMLSRCEVHSLLVGIAIALPSGAAVAIAILGENIGSLVGVAISASLLPPAVNAGVLWALSCLCLVFGTPDKRYSAVVKTHLYSDNQTLELFALGCMSMCLTLLNVVCIYVMGVTFLKIKEVAPIVPKDQKQFWRHDIKIARDYNKTLHTMDGMTMSKHLIQELQALHSDGDGHGISGNERWLNNISRVNQNTWSPRHNYHQRDHRPTVQELEALYLSLSTNNGESQYHYSSHHPHNNPMKLSSSYFRSSKPWSPPKYSSIVEDSQPSSPTHRTRLGSNPMDIPGLRRPRFSDSFRGSSAPLSKIVEHVASSTSGGGHHHAGPSDGSRRDSESGGGGGGGGKHFKISLKKPKQFTVTPAFDPIKK